MSLSLSPRAAQAFNRLATDCTKVFGDRFVALVAYGARTGVVFARDLVPSDLDALAVLVPAWHREGLSTPLVMTPEEFTRSLDAFPLEYQAMLDRHLVIAGTSPFDGVEVDRDDLRRACEVQAKGHLIHLRQGWLQAEGHAGRIAELIDRSGPTFRALLASVAQLSQAPSATTDELVTFAEKTAGMNGEVVRAVLALDGAAQVRPDIPGGLAAYVAAADRLWQYIDAWRAR